jgi:ribokinase
MNKVINCGSLNIDYVYRVPHIVFPGETISSGEYNRYCGGKGANQSIALARAGIEVKHVGQIGKDGVFLKDELKASGVEVEYIFIGKEPTGHAIIQVAEDGENSIVLFPGANHKITKRQLDSVFDSAVPDDIMLIQNETNINGYIIEKSFDKSMTICLNPAPYDESVKRLPLDKVDILIINEIEGYGLSGCRTEAEIMENLSNKYPNTIVVMTLGKKGAVCSSGGQLFRAPGFRVNTIDATAAGDTFIGYFLSGRIRGYEICECLNLACAAASLATTRHGAAASIPSWNQVEKHMIGVKNKYDFINSKMKK